MLNYVTTITLAMYWTQNSAKRVASPIDRSFLEPGTDGTFLEKPTFPADRVEVPYTSTIDSQELGSSS